MRHDDFKKRCYMSVHPFRYTHNSANHARGTKRALVPQQEPQQGGRVTLSATTSKVTESAIEFVRCVLQHVLSSSVCAKVQHTTHAGWCLAFAAQAAVCQICHAW